VQVLSRAFRFAHLSGTMTGLMLAVVMYHVVHRRGVH